MPHRPKTPTSKRSMTDLNKKEDSRRAAEPQRRKRATRSIRPSGRPVPNQVRSRSDQTRPSFRSALALKGARFLCASASLRAKPFSGFLSVSRRHQEEVHTEPRRCSIAGSNICPCSQWFPDRFAIQNVAAPAQRNSGIPMSAKTFLCASVSPCASLSLFAARLTNITGDAMVRAFKLETEPHGH